MTVRFDPRKLDKVKQQTLSGLPTSIARLVYLSSLRDFNTGRYYHAGWAAVSSEPEAEPALRETHQTVFEQVLGMPLEELVADIREFVFSATPDPAATFLAWQEAKAYQVLPPLNINPIDRELFNSSVKAALSFLTL